MNKPVVAGIGVLAVVVAVAFGVWSSSGRDTAQTQASDASSTAGPDDRVARTPPSMNEPDGRIRGTRMPDDVRDDLVRHRERIRRAVELGIGTPVPTEGDEPLAEDELQDAQPGPFLADPEGIQASFAAARPLIRECVDGYGPEVGPFDGELLVAFGLGEGDATDGVAYPSDVTVAGSDVPTAVSSCVVSVFSDLRFEPDSGAGTVTYPMNLSFDDEPR